MLNTNKIYDVIIVGAGPGGISCAYHLSSADKKVLLCDAGFHHNSRTCMVDYGKYCEDCGVTCDVISGFGGCLNYGDGLKLSFMPCARRLSDLFGEEESYLKSRKIQNMIERILKRKMYFIDKIHKENVESIFKSYGLTIRDYPVAVLSETELKIIIDKFYQKLIISKNITVLLQSKVKNVEKDHELFHVELYKGGEKLNIKTKNIVFATGRKGTLWTKNQLENLGIPTLPPKPSYGVRFLMKASILEEVGNIFPDLKISYRFSEHEKVKSFCFCGGKNGGSVKFINYYNLFDSSLIFIDGHKTSERVSLDSSKELSSTFGLLSQYNNSVFGGLDWIINKFVPKYISISNGKPLVQTYRNFRGKKNMDPCWDELKNIIPFDVCINDLRTGPLFDLFDSQSHKNICIIFEKMMCSIGSIVHKGFEIDTILDEVLVVGPEVEFFWPRSELNEFCETKLDGCYIVGDAAGYGQGIVPAMMMGLAASEKISV